MAVPEFRKLTLHDQLVMEKALQDIGGRAMLHGARLEGAINPIDGTLTVMAEALVTMALTAAEMSPDPRAAKQSLLNFLRVQLFAEDTHPASEGPLQ